MKKISVFFILMFILLQTIIFMPVHSASAQTYSFSQLVKTKMAYTRVADDYYMWTLAFTCNVASRPNTAQTSNPISWDPNWTVFVGSQLGMRIYFTFNSLGDKGLWVITCDGYHIDPRYCVYDPTQITHYFCNYAYAVRWNQPFIWRINVFNQLPIANITHTPDPAWNQTVTLKSNASDPDGGSLTYNWSILQKPPNSSATLRNPQSPTSQISFTNDRDIGIWKFQLQVTDNEGERSTFTHEFTVPNVAPKISINGATTVDVTQPVRLVASPTTDVDGGNLDIKWDIVQSPPTSTIKPITNFATGANFNLNTTRNDVGTWVIKVTARDNEGASDSKQVTITVQGTEYEILPSSDTLLSYDSLMSKEGKLTINYAYIKGTKADNIHWQVLNSAGNVVFEDNVAAETGKIEWYGKTSEGTQLEAANYTIKLEAFYQNTSIWASNPFQFTLFKVALQWGNPVQTWDQIRSPNEKMQLYIKTTPQQITKAQLIKLGLPLKLFSQYTLSSSSGVLASIFDSNNSTSILFVPQSGTSISSAIPTAGEITDTPNGILITFEQKHQFLQDDVNEFATTDNTLTTPDRSNLYDSEAFASELLKKGWTSVGQAQNKGDYSSLRPAANKQFVINAGTEYVWFTLWGVEAEKRQVNQQADWFYYSGHGHHQSGTLELPDGLVGPEDVSWKDDLDLVIIAGCSVLDIKDYRSKSFSIGSLLKWELAGGESSPGERWENTGPKYLLGYAFTAPTDDQGTQTIIETFLEETEKGASPVDAWRIANDPSKNKAAINAVVIDTSKPTHRYCYYDERQGSPNWVCVDKTPTGWPEIS